MGAWDVLLLVWLFVVDMRDSYEEDPRQPMFSGLSSKNLAISVGGVFAVIAVPLAAGIFALAAEVLRQVAYRKELLKEEDLARTKEKIDAKHLAHEAIRESSIMREDSRGKSPVKV